MDRENAKHILQKKLEEALGVTLPPLGTHEFHETILRLSQGNPAVASTLMHVLTEWGEGADVKFPKGQERQEGQGTPVKAPPVTLPSAESVPPGLSKEEMSMPVQPFAEHQEEGLPEAETPRIADGKGEESPSIPPSSEPTGRPKAKEKISRVFAQKVASKERAITWVQRFFKSLEPNWRVLVPHPRKVLVSLAILVFPFALYWVFQQPIQDFLSGRSAAASQSPSPPPPPPPPPSETGVGAPPPPPPESAASAASEETGANSAAGADSAAEKLQESQSTANSETVSPPPPPQTQGQSEGQSGASNVPPPPSLPVYGEPLPPPPAGQGAVGAPGEGPPPPTAKVLGGENKPLGKVVSPSSGDGVESGGPTIKRLEASAVRRGGTQGVPAGDGEVEGTSLRAGVLVVRKVHDSQETGPYRSKGNPPTTPKRGPEIPPGDQDALVEGEASLSPAPPPSSSPRPQAANPPASDVAPPPFREGGSSLGSNQGPTSLPLPSNIQNLNPSPTPRAQSSQVSPSSSPFSTPSQGSGSSLGGVVQDLALKYGQVLNGEVLTGIVFAEGTLESPILIRLKDGDREMTAFGTASLNPRTNRVTARFDRLYVGEVAYVVNGYLVDGRGTIGIYARVSEEAPNVAVNLLRGAFGGLKQYVDYYARATQTTIVPGTGVVSSSAPPPLGITVLSSALGQLAAPPDQISIVRVWSVEAKTPVGVILAPPQP